MDVLCVILDWRPDFLSDGQSLLLTPIGTRRLLERLVDNAADAQGQWFILPGFAPTDGYAREIGNLSPRARILARGHLDAWLLGAEASDAVLILDARRPLHDASAVLRAARDVSTPAARHFIPRDRLSDDAREHILARPGGEVVKIERLYEGRTQVRAGAACAALLSVATLRSAQARGGWSELRDLRIALVEQGIPSLDVLLDQPAFELTQEAGLVALCEHELAQCLRRPARDDWHDAAPQVRVHASARIHPEARLVGPLVVHAGAAVDAGAVLLGPAVVGPGATLAAGAVVCESVIAGGARVEAGHSVLRRVQSGVRPKGGPTGDAPRASSEPRSVEAPRGAHSIAAANDRVYMLVKRWVDGVLAAVGLVALSPLLLAVALLIKLTSRGPVLFGHDREGLGGRPFRCWKFRTMVHHAHSMQRALYEQNAVDGPQFKLSRDPRITWLGRYLRLTNLDEIPQLWNVLLGQMSLIGPRPSPFRENQICVPWRNARLSVRPGITGLWQICRHDRDLGDFHQWIHFDTLYVRHMSAWLDFKILLATALTVGGRWSVPVEWLVPSRRTEAAPRPAGVGSVSGWLDIDVVRLFSPTEQGIPQAAPAFDTIGRQVAGSAEGGFNGRDDRDEVLRASD